MRNKVFISYAHLDQEENNWIKKLKKHLGFFERSKILKVWDDSKLIVGKNPKEQIIEIINESKIAILLIGPEFLNSKFINEIELPRILEAARVDGLEIFPLLTNYCQYLKSELRDFWAYNNIDKPLESLPIHEQNRELYEFCSKLEEVYNRSDELEIPEILTGIDSLYGLQQIELDNKRLTCCNFTSRKNQILCAGFEKEIFNVNLKNNSKESIMTLDSNARTIFRFPNSSIFLISFDTGDVYSVNSSLFNFKKAFSCKSSVFSISINENGKTLITTERNGEVNEWRINNLFAITDEDENPQIDFLRLLTVHSSISFMFKLFKIGSKGISIGADGIISNIDLENGKVKSDGYYSKHSLYCIDISDNNLVAIGANEGKVFLFDKNFKRHEIQIHKDTVRTLVLSPKGNWLFTGSKDKTVKIRNLNTNKTWILFKSMDYIYDIKFSRAHNQVLACDGAGNIFTFNFETEIDLLSDEIMNKLLKESL